MAKRTSNPVAEPETSPARATADSQWRNGTLFVVEDECSFSADRTKGEITIESTGKDFPRAIEELQGKGARELASSYAMAMGMGDARINGNTIGPIPVNEDGIALDQVADARGKRLLPTHQKMQPKKYRCIVPVMRKLI